ncbi:TonB family protein [Cellvibrio sp. NN19]|uniref:energy transducer TonB n=1 Tax=Cellvibrio chitinivorans TaxID=3102792 RepID=UPI002B416954|nr:TonB family protein [Cellvibrio sp. NN19]
MSSSAAFTRSYDQSHVARHHSLLSLMGAIPAAFFITVGLLYIMFLLVHKDYPVIVPKPVPAIPNVVADFPEKIPTFEDPLPVKPVEQNQPPVIRNNEQVDVDPEPGISILDPIVVVKPPIDGGVGAGGQMVPFIKIAPQYPQNAAAKGIEGYVDVMFDVTPLGTTDNIRIIAYVPSTIFNKSVIKAIKGWKYKPNTVDGVPVKTFDVKDRVRFTMEK